MFATRTTLRTFQTFPTAVVVFIAPAAPATVEFQLAYVMNATTLINICYYSIMLPFLLLLYFQAGRTSVCSACRIIL